MKCIPLQKPPRHSIMMNSFQIKLFMLRRVNYIAEKQNTAMSRFSSTVPYLLKCIFLPLFFMFLRLGSQIHWLMCCICQSSVGSQSLLEAYSFSRHN